jgi:hypothetical protein
MRFVQKAFLVFLLTCGLLAGPASAQHVGPLPAPLNPPTPRPANGSGGTITIPAGTKVILAMTQPIWAKSAHIGDGIYAVSAFPVSIDNVMAIPPGTHVEGRLDFIARPTRKTDRAEFQMHFTKLVFAGGYTVELPVQDATPIPGGSDPLAPLEVPTVKAAATAAVHALVYFTSDVLLDNGSQIEMEVQSALALDAEAVAEAARQSQPPPIEWKSATRCRPVAGTPGTPGTPDTIIPGTPRTPDIVIPGANGMPNTVIPGNPGTPTTVIPGTPGTPGTPGYFCPAPPAVFSEAGETHKESFKIAKGGIQLAGQALAKGTYQAAWIGSGPSDQVQISQKGKVLATVAARVATLLDQAAKTQVNVGVGVAPAVLAIEFKGQSLALIFTSAAGSSGEQGKNSQQASATTPPAPD